MSLIRRHTTRTAVGSTETTEKTDTPSSSPLAFPLTALQKFYLAFRAPFACRYFHFATPNDAAHAVTVKYWNGAAFAAVEDLIDQTLGFTQNGFIAWKNVAGWKARSAAPFADQELYWIEISVATDLDADCSLQAVLNLFCDDSLLRAYYPALVADSRYLPEGRTDFLEQYIAAKDLIVTRLKQGKAITDESQIIDPNEVAIAAVHAAAHIIMAPLDRGEDPRPSDDARDAMNGEMNRVSFDLDTDNSGEVEVHEQERSFEVRLRR